MRTNVRTAVLLAFFIVPPAGAHAQQLAGPDETATPPATDLRSPEGPIHLILRHRGDLELTPEQVVKIERIRAVVEERNQKVIREVDERLQAHRSAMQKGAGIMGEAERLRRVEEARAILVPLIRRIIVSNVNAVDGLSTVLDDGQHETATDLIGERRGEIALRVFAPAEPKEDKKGKKKAKGGH